MSSSTRKGQPESTSSPILASSSTFFDASGSEPPSSPPPFTLPMRANTSTSNHTSGSPPPMPKKSSKLCDKTFPLCTLAILLVVIITCLWEEPSSYDLSQLLAAQEPAGTPVHEILQSIPPATQPRKHNPEEWLRKNTISKYDTPAHVSRHRPRAALISLVRNEELDGLLQSMRHLQYLWNRRYNYPWVFFSETSFSDEFKAATTNATSAQTSYHRIPYTHWSTPSFINTTLHHDSLIYLGALNVGKGHLISYRHMCRWNSGFFFLHPALAAYDYYWRVEPDVHFFCHIPYDPFAFMHDNDLVYGFNMNILEDARSFPSLWKSTVEFARAHPEFLHRNADWQWLVDNDVAAGGAGGYNNCQFFSNFEIGSLGFFRSEAYQAYFRWLDEKGGFFYERFGDAPIHTLAVSLFAGREQTWFFRDVGYQHDAMRHCPPDHGDDGGSGRCMCEATKLDENFYRLVPMESPQRKPSDTCLRLWLGGEWLSKRDKWDREVEVLLGGDGYGGYVKQ